MGRCLSLTAVTAMLLVAAGCGGSSKPTDPWVVVSTQHNSSANYTIVNGSVGQPSQVEVTIVTKPKVVAKTHYTIACGPADYDAAKNKAGPTGMTPLTFRITVPTPTDGPASCYIQTGADYPSNVDTTITLLQRDVPAAASS